MKVTQEPELGPRAVREIGSLLVLALLAFAVGGTSGLLGAVFRLVLERSDRFTMAFSAPCAGAVFFDYSQPLFFAKAGPRPDMPQKLNPKPPVIAFAL
jgi:hypothetical protein